MGKIQIRLLFLAGTAAIVAAVLLAANPFGGGGEPPSAALAQPPAPDTVDAGYDLFETEPGGATWLGFELDPLPTGFFGPGSDPFDGRVYLRGEPIPDYEPPGGPRYYGLEPMDTIVRRYEDAGEEGFPDLVPIEIVALNLKSVDPITVTYGGVSPQQWDVTVEVPENDPNQTTGSMTVRHEYATGGTFDSLLPVDPLLTFTEVGGPGVVVPDYYLGPIEFGASDVPWNHTANPLASPAGHWVIEKEGLTSNFFPGIDGTSGDLYKDYFSLDDPLIPALHSVQPAELPGPFGTTVGDCSNRPSEVATGTDTFNSTASMYVDVPGDYTGWIDLEGDTIVERNPDPQEPGVIEIEIIEMSLVSTAPIGVTVTAGSGLGLPATTGDVRSASGGDDFPADSFFDVYYEIDLGGGGQYHNIDAVRMETTLNPDLEGVVCLPPYEHVFAASNVPVDLWEGETAVGTLDDAVHIVEPPRSITTIKLDAGSEEPLPGAVFTLHDGTDCPGPAVAATTTDETGVGDLGPMGGGLYSVQEVIPPAGSELPSDTCTDVDHTIPYEKLEVIPGGPILAPTTDIFPSNAKFIFAGLPLPDLDYVVLNGQAQVSRSAVTGDVIDTEIVSLELTGIHPVVGPVTVTAGAGLGSSSLPASTGQIQNVTHDGLNLTGGDSFFDVYVEVTVGGLTLVNQESPIHLSSTIDQLPPELDFFDNAFLSVLLNDWPSLDPAGEIDYTLWVPLPRGELDVIIQDPPGPPQQISYSIGFNSASNIGPPFIHAADILVPGPTVVRTCASLGLDPIGCALASPQDDMNSLSYGYDFSSANAAEPPKVFSVDETSAGLAGTEVRTEFTCNSGGVEAHADLFRTPLDGTNQQEFDGDGLSGGPSCLVSYPLGLVEPLGPASGDILNALGELPDGDPVYFTLAPGSPSLTLLPGGPYTEAHIFKSTGGSVSVYATPAQLGLVSGDVIDALSLRESDGMFDVAPADGVFDDPPDLLQFSLAPGSITLMSLGLTPPESAADQFKPKTTPAGLPERVNLATDHGLQNEDNLDAMKAPYLDADGDGVPDFIGTGGGDFNDGTVSGNIAGDITLTRVADVVQVDGGGGGGGASATCPETGSSAETDISLTLAGGEIVQIGCESSASVTIVNGPAVVGFGPFTATVETGSKVIIRELPSPAAGPCGGVTVPAGAYQIVHSVGTLDVIISSASMSPVALPPGSVYRDCDGDAIFGAVDNCTDDSNPPQTNTDVDLNTGGATVAGVPLLTDTDGDICDDDDDNDSFNGTTTMTQTPGAAATACPGGSVDIWADCVESYLGTDLDDNCNGAPGAGTDAWPPDASGNGIISAGDVFAVFPSWMTSTARYDLDASGTVSAGDVFSIFPLWMVSCS